MISKKWLKCLSAIYTVRMSSASARLWKGWSMRGFKFRFHPTLKQRRYLAQAFGVRRFVWNWALATKRDAYREHGESIGLCGLSRLFTKLRNEKKWLKEVNRQVQTQTLRDLNHAYSDFYAKRSNYPRFKNRSAPQSIRFGMESRHPSKTKAWAIQKLVLPHLGECRLVNSYGEWPAMPSLVTVQRDRCGLYWVCFSAEAQERIVAPDGAVGVDVGLANLAVTSDGWKSGQLAGLREKAVRLRRYQRHLSRKRRGSRRRAKARVRFARLHQRIAFARKNFIHQVSHRITSRADVIALETLNIAGMLKNHTFARALADASLGELHKQIQYKAARRGGTVIRVGRFEPTSKVCSDCGHYMSSMLLSVRSWTCPGCGSEHDRDVNAARNVLAIARGAGEFTRGDRGGSEAAQAGSVPLDEPRICAAVGERPVRSCAA
jgi:putative transposase